MYIIEDKCWEPEQWLRRKGSLFELAETGCVSCSCQIWNSAWTWKPHHARYVSWNVCTVRATIAAWPPTRNIKKMLKEDPFSNKSFGTILNDHESKPSKSKQLKHVSISVLLCCNAYLVTIVKHGCRWTLEEFFLKVNPSLSLNRMFTNADVWGILKVQEYHMLKELFWFQPGFIDGVSGSSSMHPGPGCIVHTQTRLIFSWTAKSWMFGWISEQTPELRSTTLQTTPNKDD